MKKRIAIAFVVVLAALVVYRAVTWDATNQKVAAEIRDNPQGERAQKTMLITLPDSRSYPVNYLREGELVFMGIDGRWWRDFVDQPVPVTLLIRGQTLHGHARTILDDPTRQAEVFARLRPTAPAWLPDWLNGKLVEITLGEAPG